MGDQLLPLYSPCVVSLTSGSCSLPGCAVMQPVQNSMPWYSLLQPVVQLQARDTRLLRSDKDGAVSDTTGVDGSVAASPKNEIENLAYHTLILKPLLTLYGIIIHHSCGTVKPLIYLHLQQLITIP